MRAPARRALLSAIVAGASIAGVGCDQKTIAPTDRTPPELTVESPVASATVSGVSFTVEVTATDDQGVERVVFSLGNTPVITVTEEPFDGRVITVAEPAGAATLTVEAFDAAGNSTTATVGVTVASRTIRRLTNDPNQDMHPSFSPDGSMIAFQAKRAKGTFDIWTMNVDGTSQTRRTFNLQNDRSPVFSPDGLWIAFESSRMGGFDLYRMPVATGEADIEALTFGNLSDLEPAFTPNGLDVFFASSRGDDGDFNIWRIPATGGDANAVPVVTFDEEDRAPAISPDGATLAFVSNVNFGSRGHVYTMSLGDLSVSPLTGDLGIEEFDPAWFPGGEVIVFTRDDGIDSNLWMLGLDGDTPVQVTFGTGPVIGDGGPAWSPDGSRLAFHSDRDGNPEIYVME